MAKRFSCIQRRCGLAWLLLLFWVGVAAAQPYPTKTIRFIVAFPPGGSSDIVGRELAHRLGSVLKANVLVENRAGANGVLGSKALARATPDGHTVMLHILPSHIANAALHKNPPYDVLADFASISLVGSSALVFAANPSFPAKSIDELIVMAKAALDPINVGSFGNGSMAHVSIALLCSLADIKVLHVPYGGSGPAVVAALAGHVPVSVVGLPAALPYIASGRLRPLAVTSRKRLSQLPDVPAVAETPGFAGYDEGLMYGLLAPAGTPSSIIGQLHKATVSVLAAPSAQARLSELGVDHLVGSSPAEMDAYIRAELERLRKLVQWTGIQPY